jgi:hypothetical protein
MPRMRVEAGQERVLLMRWAVTFTNAARSYSREFPEPEPRLR